MAQSTQEMAAGLRAVYVGILAMSGEKAKAYELAEKIRPELLLKEELVFLDMAL